MPHSRRFCGFFLVALCLTPGLSVKAAGSPAFSLPTHARVCIESRLTSTSPLPDNFSDRIVGLAIVRWFARHGGDRFEVVEATSCQNADLVIATRTRIAREHDAYDVDFTARAGKAVYTDKIHRQHAGAWGGRRGGPVDPPGPSDPWLAAVRAGLAEDAWTLSQRFSKTLTPPLQ